MNRLFSSVGALALAFGADAALAADMRAPVTKAPAAVAAPLFNWSGFYVGAHAGGIRFKAKHAVSGATGTVDVKDSGFIGGGLAGYNWQAANWVFGLEGDGGWSSAETTDIVPGPGPLETRMRWDAHLRARLGYASNNVLWFVAGGAAFANFRETALAGPGAPADTQTVAGYTIGGGVDIAVSPNFILRAEYLYSDYDRDRFSFVAAGGGTIDTEFKTHTVRAAAIWRFATGKAPVAAPAVVTKY